LNEFTAFSLSRVRGSYPDFLIPPNIGAHHFSAEKQLTMPPQKKSKKNTPAVTGQQDHHPLEENGVSFVPEPSNITDQERRAKLEALMKARAEKTAHIQEQPGEQQTHENVDDDDDTIDKELERVQQKIQQLQKDNEKFASQLQIKRKISKKLEQLNQAREQIEAIQREIDEMKEQENSSLWQESPHHNPEPTRRPRKKTSSRETESHTL
jgi:DNA repair exonuclease SbcCD ATPase subunit